MSHWYGFKIGYIMDKMTLGQVMIYYGNIPMEGRLQTTTKKRDTDIVDKAKLKAFMGGQKVKYG